ncbi:MAG TPA: 6-bladed beta-propeller [Terriglobales bacterium]
MAMTKLKPITIWLAISALVFALAPYSHAKKKKEKESEVTVAKSKSVDHSLIDTSNLVWPLPPDIPRIKFVQEVFGEEKLPVAPGQKAPKKKQGWMDRVAGLQTTDTGAIKQEFRHLLGKPYGVGVDSKGRIYVADTFVSAVFVFDLEKKETKLLRNGVEAKFGTIIGLTVDDADRVFVVDALMHRVGAFDKDWKLETYFGDADLGHPGGIAIDEENRFLYVVDTDRERVAVFDADNFKLLRTIGGPPKSMGDEDPGTFSKPSNVAVDKDGNVYVTDTMNNRVQVFDGDGKFISTFGKAGDGPGTFARPKGISVDSDGHIWVVDAFQNRVQIFDTEGHLLAFFGTGGGLQGQFTVPSGVYVDKFNRAFVTDQMPGRLQMFRYVTDAEAKQLKEERDHKAAAVKPAGPQGTTVAEQKQ